LSCAKAIACLGGMKLKNFASFHLTLWRLLGFGDFREKKRLNARGFAREFLWSGMLYRPGKSLNRCGKSSSLHSKNFLLGGCGFFVSDVISGGLLGHLSPLCLALGTNRLVVVFRWSFYWKLGYNPSLLILWMTCWGFGFENCDVS